MPDVGIELSGITWSSVSDAFVHDRSERRVGNQERKIPGVTAAQMPVSGFPVDAGRPVLTLGRAIQIHLVVLATLSA